jgi:hypothetical protein
MCFRRISRWPRGKRLTAAYCLLGLRVRISPAARMSICHLWMLRVIRYKLISIMKPTWCTFFSIYWESRASTCFEHYLLILRKRYTNGFRYIDCGTVVVSLLPCHSQLILYACNIPNAVCVTPPEDEQVMLETCRGHWFSVNWKKSVSHWFNYTVDPRVTTGLTYEQPGLRTKF